VKQLRAVGFKGFLVGESLMRANDAGHALREFIIRSAESDVDHSRTLQIKIKICGLTSLEDARAAIAAGADFLGFNFYSLSPRYIQPESAAKIIHELRSSESATHQVKMIGVFVNSSEAEVSRIADEVGLDGVQLHGDESIEFCESLRAGSPRLFQMKAFAGKSRDDLNELIDYPSDAIMLDGFDVKLRGGTGHLADWSLARRAAKKLPRLFLAGGLSPENVADAINAVRPFAVDACSSLEAATGKKDADRMKRFVAAARSVTLSPDY